MDVDAGQGSVSPQLLALLRCPRDQSRLQPAEPELVRRVNQAASEGRLQNVGGILVENPIDGALVRADGALLYPVFDQIPVMLPDEAIEVSNL